MTHERDDGSFCFRVVRKDFCLKSKCLVRPRELPPFPSLDNFLSDFIRQSSHFSPAFGRWYATDLMLELQLTCYHKVGPYQLSVEL